MLRHDNSISMKQQQDLCGLRNRGVAGGMPPALIERPECMEDNGHSGQVSPGACPRLSLNAVSVVGRSDRTRCRRG